ncbi:O-acetyl-ADP-ribose deacetylase [bacterium]|nr:O-acetyl-ADP-ribose deacetylase [bacterium]
MAIKIVKGDITKIKADAIVNAANESLLGGGGVEGAIHRAAGPQLLEECRKLQGCKVGEAKITAGYKLPAEFIIHTVGPVWKGGGHDEEQQLTNCFHNSLRLAAKNGIETIAFPLISSGVYGYPKDKAIRVAMNAFEAFLTENDIDITLVLYDNKTFELSEKLYADIEKFIGENYVDEDRVDYGRRNSYTEIIHSRKLVDKCESPRPLKKEAAEPPVADSDEVMSAFEDFDTSFEIEPPHSERAESPRPFGIMSLARPKRSLEDLMKERAETFSQCLLRLIDQKGLNDVEVYKRANIDRKLFSKIRSDKDYKPSKITAVAFAIALSLSLDETIDLIGKAGFTLSMGVKFDLIIRYFIEQGNYKIYEINEALFAFDQLLLGV